MTAGNRRKEEQSKAKLENSGESSVSSRDSAMADKAARNDFFLPSNEQGAYIATIESVISSRNMMEAYKAVIRNKGAPGIDGITTKEIKKVIQEQWPKIKQDILDGKYYPSPVRRVEIPKPDGHGVRQLGIPIVMDRIIQQAIYYSEQKMIPFKSVFVYA
jgi:hypothetical protein